MTLYCFALQEQQVDVVTDSMGITDTFDEYLYHDDKAMFFPSLNVLEASVGMMNVGLRFRQWLTVYEQAAAAGHRDAAGLDIDTIARLASQDLPEMWDLSNAGRAEIGLTPRVTEINLFGWCEQRQRMAGYALGAGDPRKTSPDWHPLEIIEWTNRGVLAQYNEKYRHRAWWHVRPSTRGRIVPLAGGQEHRLPTSDDEWAEIAQYVRRAQLDRPAEDRMAMGGDVHRVTLTPEGCTRRVIFTFDDTGAEFEQLTEAGRRDGRTPLLRDDLVERMRALPRPEPPRATALAR